MTAVSTYGVTGDTAVDGILSGTKWAVTELTFSFPSSGSLYGSTYGSGENTKNFAAFTTTQQAATRDVLAQFAAVSNLTFTEVTETSTVHGELRYAESDGPSTAWAYYPSTNTIGGDAWFNNSLNYYSTPVKGNYAYLTMMHETGHALGLKHAHEVSGSFGAVPANMDSLEYTVMSYKSYVGGPTTGYTNGATSYPQSLMMLDIAAVQKLYGADYSTNAGDTVYRWSATTGEMSLNGVGQGAPAGNKIFLTIWDGGGNDTYDFSNYATNLSVDLQPGGWTSVSSTQLASLGNGKVAAGNIANALLYEGNAASLIENVVGGAGGDTIKGNVADNTFTGGAGNDVLNGLAGFDTAVYSGAQSNYAFAQNSDGSWSVTDRSGVDGVDVLWNIEQLRFSDSIFALTGGVVTEPVVTQPDPVIVNTAPIASADAYAASTNRTLSVTAVNGVLKNDVDPDGDALSAALVSTTTRGKLTFNSDGSFVYTPNKNFKGTDSFSYKVSDGESASGLVTVTLTVGSTTTFSTKGRGQDATNAFDFSDVINKLKWSGAGVDHHEIPKPLADIVALPSSRFDDAPAFFQSVVDLFHKIDADYHLV